MGFSKVPVHIFEILKGEKDVSLIDYLIAVVIVFILCWIVYGILNLFDKKNNKSLKSK